jgi:hypothetical protein
MAGYFKNTDRWGNETNNNSALDFNPVPIDYTPSASGNSANTNSFVIDPNGDMYFIDSEGDSFYINTSNPLDVLSGVQPTPTGSGNTTNLNSVFKDANGDTWIVDWKGDAVKAASAPVPETVTTITNRLTAGNKIGTYTNEAGTAVDIFETVTSVSDFSIAGSTITLKYVDETGTENTKSFDLPAAVAETVIVSRMPVINGFVNVWNVGVFKTILAPKTPLLPSQYKVVCVPVAHERAVPPTVLMPTV